MVTKKIRTVFYLDKAERKTFDRLSRKTGAPLGELLRRAVAMYLKAQKKKIVRAVKLGRAHGILY